MTALGWESRGVPRSAGQEVRRSLGREGKGPIGGVERGIMRVFSGEGVELADTLEDSAGLEGCVWVRGDLMVTGSVIIRLVRLRNEDSGEFEVRT